MPLTITDSGGTVRHVWQLPLATTPEPEDETAYAYIDVELTDGHRSSIQTGFDAGTKGWKFRAPTLASLEVLPNTVTDIHGATVSREQYVWSLFESGEIFVLTDPYDGEYYFADFADEDLTMQRARIKMYSVGINLRQRRIAGVYIP